MNTRGIDIYTCSKDIYRISLLIIKKSFSIRNLTTIKNEIKSFINLLKLDKYFLLANSYKYSLYTSIIHINIHYIQIYISLPFFFLQQELKVKNIIVMVSLPIVRRNRYRHFLPWWNERKAIYTTRLSQGSWKRLERKLLGTLAKTIWRHFYTTDTANATKDKERWELTTWIPQND